MAGVRGPAWRLSPAVNHNVFRSDVERQFELDEYDRVRMVHNGDCHIIGRKDHIRTEMWRFLRTMLAGRFQEHDRETAGYDRHPCAN